MNWESGTIEGVEVRVLKRHADDRGWLAELYRSDEVEAGILPAMGYISVTRPGQKRGPHEHIDQTDMFGFAGPGNFRVRLWDNREESPTYGKCMELCLGEDNPAALVVPPRVIHGYANLSNSDAWVLNFPNRLFAGEGRREPVDEIRHEESGNRDFSLD